MLNIFHDIPRGVQLGTNDREAGVGSKLGRRVEYHEKYST